MPRPKPVVFGLYSWSPEYGFRYVHPANRRSFELLEPVGKLFERIGEDEEGEWLTIRYDEQQFLVRPELFKEIYHKPKFSFGDAVEEVTPQPGEYRHFGHVSDVFWDEATDTATFQIVERKRKLPRVFAAAELRADWTLRFALNEELGMRNEELCHCERSDATAGQRS